MNASHCLRCLLVLTSVCLMGCTYSNVSPERAALQFFSVRIESDIRGGADFYEGPTGVMMDISVFNLPAGAHQVLLLPTKDCLVGSGETLMELQVNENKDTARGQSFLPGRSIAPEKNFLGQAVTVGSSGGLPLACGIIQPLR